MDQNPFFRKMIVPWYDSDTACYIFLAVMGIVIFFGFTGISAARENPYLHAYIWVPVLVIILSMVVTLSILIRLIKRYLHRHTR